MIRINILRNRGGTSSLKTSVSSMTGITFLSTGNNNDTKISVGSDEKKAMIQKALIALLFPVLLVGYDQVIKIQKASELQSLQTEKTTLQQKLKAYGPKVDSVKKFQVEKERLQKRIDIIKNVSKERLRLVKALDALHRTIPQQAWLTELVVKDDYKAKLTGYALDDFVVSNLIQNLDESIFFENVSLLSSQESSVAEGKLRKFEVAAHLGDQ